ncbi:MAG TPA: hypothetical protein VLS48_07230, partial [Anaerolineales bacterium]|nr:hypothetical protein [Anaerolineales bacterium]
MFRKVISVLLIGGLLAGCAAQAQQAPQSSPRLEVEKAPATPTPRPDLGQLPTPQGNISSPLKPLRTSEGGLAPGLEQAGGGYWMPKPEDRELVRGNVFIDGARILVQGGDSPEVTLQLEGSMPTPCHELRVDPQPADEQRRITIEVYSVVAPEMLCAQVLQ